MSSVAKPEDDPTVKEDALPLDEEVDDNEDGDDDAAGDATTAG